MSVLLGVVAVRYCGAVRIVMSAHEVRISAPDVEVRWSLPGPHTQQEATRMACCLVRGLDMSPRWVRHLSRVILDGNRREVASWLGS